MTEKDDRFSGSDQPDPNNQFYLVLSRVKQSSMGGMGDAEFHFEYLCINAHGERCIVSEDYVQFNRNPQGLSCIEEGNLYHWSIRTLPPDTADCLSGKSMDLYRQATTLIQPPFTPKLR